MTVSIVIPTYNRLRSLRLSLESLTIQTYPLDRCEVVVVDDGSTDGTDAITQDVYPFTLHYVRQANRGSAAARNAGAEVAQGRLLIFLDDDMSVEADYVMSLVSEHQRFPRVVGMGTPRPFLPRDATVFAQIYAHLTVCENVAPTGLWVAFTDCATNNLSVEHDDFFEIGMMQDIAGDGPTLWGDVDFGYRAARLGFRFRRSGTAICYHRDHCIVDLATAILRAQQVGSTAVSLFRMYPELHPHLPMFRDKVPINWSQDGHRLVARRTARRLVSSRPLLWGMQQAAKFCETHCPSPHILMPLYRWIIGGHIFQGYRERLRRGH